MPGDPVIMLLGPEAVALSQKDYASLKTEYGLDQPLWKQYIRYWHNLSTGSLGYSHYQRRPVAHLVCDHLGRTLTWTLPAFFLSLVSAAFWGTWAGWKPGSWGDLLMIMLALVFYATPPFLVGMLALNLFSMRLNWLPSGGLLPATGEIGSGLDRFYQTLKHLVLPVAVLVLASFPSKFMVMRNAVVDVRQEPYVFFARARGLPARRVLFVHIFYNAFPPLLHLSALHLGFIISGAVLVEVLFSINGMGSLILQAALHRDYPVLQGSFFILAVVIMALNFLIDWLSRCLDPRVDP